jgi:hypothetical protein
MSTIASRGFYTVAGLLAVTGGLLYRCSFTDPLRIPRFDGANAVQNKLIYPAHVPGGSRQHVDTPNQYGMPDYEDLTLTTPDGLKIRAYLVPRPDAAQRPTLLYLHANAGNMGHRLPIARVFGIDMQMNLLLLSVSCACTAASYFEGCAVPRLRFERGRVRRLVDIPI